ncbi:MAG: Jag N-terminal domain-containing protein, partial [Acidimicrobiales bacterium]
MEWVQTSGKTIDEAKERALDELGVDDRDAEFEVLEEPRSGLFGLTRGDAKVRARVRPTSPRPKQERGRRRSGASGRDHSRSPGGNGGGRSRGSRGGGNGGNGGGRGGNRGGKGGGPGGNRGGGGGG